MKYPTTTQGIHGTLSGILPGIDKGTVMYTVFDDAVAAHISWLVRFESVMLGSSKEQFDPGQTGDESLCELAHWLDANPALFPDAERFEQIRNLHRSFHEQAAAIATLLGSQAQSGTIQAHWTKLCGLSDRLVETIQEELEHHRQAADPQGRNPSATLTGPTLPPGNQGASDRLA